MVLEVGVVTKISRRYRAADFSAETPVSKVWLRPCVLTSTSATVTAQYNVDYTVSVVATNCAGNSTTAEYNFRIGESTSSLNI